MNVAFAASKLKQRNINLTFENHFVVDRVIKYLYFTRFLIIQYDTDESKKQTFVYANDASFTDNSNRKNFQKFMMKLFDDFVSWKICKQFTIITFNTEIELLILFFIIRKAMFFIKLFRAIKLNFQKQLMIQYDNRQTIRLISKKNVKLNTRLKYVDIHNYWLKQKKKYHKIEMNVFSQNVSEWFNQNIVQTKTWDFYQIDRFNQHFEKVNYEKKIEKKNQLMISVNQKKSIIFFYSKMKIRKTKSWWLNSVLWRFSDHSHMCTRRNGVGWVGFWDQKPNPRKVWVGRVGFGFGVGWVGFFFRVTHCGNIRKKIICLCIYSCMHWIIHKWLN